MKRYIVTASVNGFEVIKRQEGTVWAAAEVGQTYEVARKNCDSEQYEIVAEFNNDAMAEAAVEAAKANERLVRPFLIAAEDHVRKVRNAVLAASHETVKTMAKLDNTK